MAEGDEPIGARGLEEPLNQWAGETVEAGQFKRNILHHDGTRQPAERLPRLVAQHFTQVQRLDFRR